MINTVDKSKAGSSSSQYDQSQTVDDMNRYSWSYCKPSPVPCPSCVRCPTCGHYKDTCINPQWNYDVINGIKFR